MLGVTQEFGTGPGIGVAVALIRRTRDATPGTAAGGGEGSSRLPDAGVLNPQRPIGLEEDDVARRRRHVARDPQFLGEGGGGVWNMENAVATLPISKTPNWLNIHYLFRFSRAHRTNHVRCP